MRPRQALVPGQVGRHRQGQPDIVQLSVLAGLRRRILSRHTGRCAAAADSRVPRAAACADVGRKFCDVANMREHLVRLVGRIMAGDYADDAELISLVDECEKAVLRPNAASLIFWSGDEFDHEPTAGEVVDRALAYRPIER